MDTYNKNIIHIIIYNFIGCFFLYILSKIPLNYIWGTFSGKLSLLSGGGFGVFMLTPYAYIPYIFTWIVPFTIFYKLPTLSSLVWLRINTYSETWGKFFYSLIMFAGLVYFYTFFSFKTLLLYCSGWISGLFIVNIYSGYGACLYGAIWLSHVVGTLFYEFFSHQVDHFYCALAPIMYCERLCLFFAALGSYFLLTYLKNNIIVNVVSQKIYTFIDYSAILIKKIIGNSR